MGILETYKLESTVHRFNIFKENVLKVVQNNQDPTSSFKMAVNQFTGFTIDELVGSAIMINFTCPVMLPPPNSQPPTMNNEEPLPTNFNW